MNNMSDTPESDLLSQSTRGENALDVAAAVVSIVPWLGSPLATVLSGMSSSRKMRRIGDVIARVSAEVKELRTEAQKTYVRSEDFEELLEQTLRAAADEKSEEKRQIYGDFLAGAVNSPGEPAYEEQIRILRTLEQLQPDHMRLIRALAKTPDSTKSGYTGSPIETIVERLPGMPEARIDDLVQQLNDLRITNTGQLRTMMTWSGAQNLRSRITPFGERFLAFLR
jgi:hypothetical protein